MMNVDFRAEMFDVPAVRKLDAEIYDEYVRRYGSGDGTTLSVEDFTPPAGVFIVAYQSGNPVACGAWRSHGVADAEMKRVYVTPTARGTGLARSIVSRLENDARNNGRERMILETGMMQPEAVSLYRSMGYHEVEPFGFYADEEGAIHLGKSLVEAVLKQDHASA